MRQKLLKYWVYSIFLFPVVSSADEPTPVVGWNVDCNNYCNFYEFNHDCQGLFWYYADGTKSYAAWSSNYNACQEFAPLAANTHIIYPSQVQCGCPTPTKYPPSNPSAGLTSTTRAQLEVLRAQVQSWTVCTPPVTTNFADKFNAVSYKNLNTCQYFRKNRMKPNYMAVGGCYPGLLGWEDTGWHHCNFSGDQLSNEAENCMSGDQDRCGDIKDSQDQATGMWYRNPYERRHPETGAGQPLFSRDALMGLLGYMNMSHDKEAFRKWLTFVRNNVKSPPLGLFNICPPRPNIPKPAEVSQKDWDDMLFDDRCGLVPSAAGLVYQTAIASGLTNADLNAIGTDFYSALASGSTTVAGAALGEANTATAVGPGSFMLGDTADSIFNSMLAGGSGHSTLVQAGGKLNERTGMLNPGYHYLAQDKNPTEYGAYLINKYCKATRPQYGVWFSTGWPGQGNNTSGYWNQGAPLIAGNYQYTGGWGPYSQKIVPIGHDCIAWLNMYLGNGTVTEGECEAGDEYINGACKKFEFTKPTLAAIPGLDYKLRKSDAKITYMAIDLNKCPYGGVLEVGSWPDFFRCAIPSGLSPSQLYANVNYWVDPAEGWAGVYYSKVNGACPYGGTAGVNCQLKGYAAPVISQYTHYWVDTNPSWPGVYYQKINGACSLGGSPAGPNCQVKGFASGVLKTSTQYLIRANPGHPGVYYYPKAVPEKRFRVVDPRTATDMSVEASHHD